MERNRCCRWQRWIWRRHRELRLGGKQYLRTFVDSVCVWWHDISRRRVYEYRKLHMGCAGRSFVRRLRRRWWRRWWWWCARWWWRRRWASPGDRGGDHRWREPLRSSWCRRRQWKSTGEPRYRWREGWLIEHLWRADHRDIRRRRRWRHSGLRRDVLQWRCRCRPIGFFRRRCRLFVGIHHQWWLECDCGHGRGRCRDWHLRWPRRHDRNVTRRLLGRRRWRRRRCRGQCWLWLHHRGRRFRRKSELDFSRCRSSIRCW